MNTSKENMHLLDQLGFMFGAAWGLMMQKKPRDLQSEEELKVDYNAIRAIIEKGKEND